MNGENVGMAGGMVLSWVILAMIVSVPIFSLLRAWFIDGVIDAPVAFAGIMGICCLVAFSWQAQGTIWMLFSVALLLGISIASPFVGSYLNKRGMKDLDEKDIARYRATIESDPNNVAAYIFLGDALAKRGSYTAAAAQYERAREISPRHPELPRKIERVRKQAAGEVASVRVRICPQCDQENDATLKLCKRCGAKI